MGRPTAKGLKLAYTLRNYLSPTITSNENLSSICSDICRSATTLAKIAERQCSEEMSDKEIMRIERLEKTLENKIDDIVNKLSLKHSIPIRTIYNGDPRGYVVSIGIRREEIGIA